MAGTQAGDGNRVFITKQPILDAKRRIWGYELTASDRGAGEAFASRESASESLTSSSYIGLQEAMDRGKMVVLGFDAKGIVELVPYALPPKLGVIRASAEAGDMPGAVDAIARMKADGYALVADATPETFPKAKIYGLADIIAFDQSFPKLAAAKFAAKAKGLDAELLVRRVAGLDQFEAARAAGFSYFQGSFFKEPEIIPDRKLTSHEISRVNMFRVIEAEEPDFDALAEAIKADVAVSFRLLTYLNSASFGFMQKIDSINRAISVLGWNKVRNWLRAVLLADMSGKEDGQQELVSLSLQRGRFLELLAREYDYWGFNPGTLFLLGLFSLLDAILGMPMAEVVELLPLDVKLKSALRRESNNEYQPLFELIGCFEDGDLDRAEAIMQNLSFDPDAVRDCYRQAMDWANAFFAASGAKA